MAAIQIIQLVIVARDPRKRNLNISGMYYKFHFQPNNKNNWVVYIIFNIQIY